ncbi:MAG: formylmethanofuran dehydrogenase subunit B, partial [Gammaproteobacteria bacterium]
IKTRSAGFILGGNDGATTAANVTAWLTGYPLRISFARGYADYDPEAYSTANLLESGAVDSVLWLSALNADNKLPATGKLPTIVIADSDKAFDKEPDVFIPAGIPGVDHKGTLIRCDSVVSLPLQQLRDNGHPAAAEILKAIHAKL